MFLYGSAFYASDIGQCVRVRILCRYKNYFLSTFWVMCKSPKEIIMDIFGEVVGKLKCVGVYKSVLLYDNLCYLNSIIVLPTRSLHVRFYPLNQWRFEFDNHVQCGAKKKFQSV